MAEIDGRWHHTFSGAGEVSNVVGPGVSKEMKRKVREEVGQSSAAREVVRLSTD